MKFRGVVFVDCVTLREMSYVPATCTMGPWSEGKWVDMAEFRKMRRARRAQERKEKRSRRRSNETTN